MIVSPPVSGSTRTLKGTCFCTLAHRIFGFCLGCPAPSRDDDARCPRTDPRQHTRARCGTKQRRGCASSFVCAPCGGADFDSAKQLIHAAHAELLYVPQTCTVALCTI